MTPKRRKARKALRAVAIDALFGKRRTLRRQKSLRARRRRQRKSKLENKR